jgi:hypothetical protein
MLTLLILLIHASVACGFLALGLGLFVMGVRLKLMPAIRSRPGFHRVFWAAIRKQI